MKYLALFASGFMTEFIWVASTLAVQSRSVWILVGLALVWPFIQAAMYVIVDAESWALRIRMLAVVAVGDVLGLLTALEM